MMYHFVIQFSEHTFQHAFVGGHLSTNGEVNGADCCFHFTQNMLFSAGVLQHPVFLRDSLQVFGLVVNALCTYILLPKLPKCR